MIKSCNLKLLFLVLLAVCGQLLLFLQRDVFHIDELFSFALANGENGVYLYHLTEEINDKVLSGDVFRRYLTQGEHTSFAQMWQNLPSDNHMPVFFVLLRAVSCFFNPFVFSSVPGVILNIVILCGLIVSFYYLSKKVFKDDIVAYLAVGLFMFSYTVLSLEIYIRMYLLQMFLSVLLILKMIDLVENIGVKRRFLIIWGITVLNILCHYYSIIFCFTVTCSVGFVLLLQKRKSDFVFFLITMFLAVVMAYLIYPAMLTVGIQGERGGQFVALIFELKDRFVSIFIRQMNITMETIFDNVWIGVVMVSLYFYMFLFENKNSIKFLCGVFVLYSFFVGLIMPQMIGFQIRYFAPIMPICFLLFVRICLILGEKWRVNGKYMLLFLGACIVYEISIALLRKENPFYFIGTRENEKMERLVKGADIWWAFGGEQEHAWIIHIWVDKLSYSENVWMLNNYNSEAFKEFAEEEKNKGKYAYLLLPKQQEVLPQGAIDWVKQTTGRQAYYLFTVKNDKMSAMVFEAAVFLICPF